MGKDEITLPELIGRIKIIGIGGAGCQVINLLMQGNNSTRTELVAIDTDWGFVRGIKAHQKVELNKVPFTGLGAGGQLDWVKRCTEASSDELEGVIADTGFVLVVAALGGSTGDGASPVIGRIAGKLGIPCLAVVTMPAGFESLHRNLVAEEGLKELSGTTDQVLVVPLDSISKEISGKTKLLSFFIIADEVLCDCISFIMGWKKGAKFADLEVRGFQVLRRDDGALVNFPKEVEKHLNELSMLQ